jgi:hypothetical protein
MADASSIRKASSLGTATTPFYKGAIRFVGNQVYVNTGTQWLPLGNVTIVTQIASINEAVDQNIFVADKAYTVTSVTEVHSTAGTDAGAVTAALMKCTGTQAASAGVAVTTAAFNLKSTANTSVTATLTATTANKTLAAGDRLALDFTGVQTALTGAVVTVVLTPA